MTEHGDQGGYLEYSGEEQDEQARAWLAQTVAEARPHLGFTAEDLVLGGRRRVRRRRAAAMVGSTASLVVVAVAAAVTTTSEPPTAPTAPAAASSSASGTKSLLDPDRTLDEARLGAAALSKMLNDLDPGEKHSSPLGEPLTAETLEKFGGMCSMKTQRTDAYSATVDWTVDGKRPFPRDKQDTSPYVQVTVVIGAPGQLAGAFLAEGWGPIATKQLSDGSTVETASADGGHYVQAIRTTTNHQQIVAFAIDDSVNGGTGGFAAARPTDPFPYTATQLGGVVGDLSLPLPFADGFQPKERCPGSPPGKP